MFSQHFLNHNFHIILNNDIKNFQPNGLQVFNAPFLRIKLYVLNIMLCLLW